jgi:hypothetical protein
MLQKCGDRAVLGALPQLSEFPPGVCPDRQAPTQATPSSGGWISTPAVQAAAAFKISSRNAGLLGRGVSAVFPLSLVCRLFLYLGAASSVAVEVATPF